MLEETSQVFGLLSLHITEEEGMKTYQEGTLYIFTPLSLYWGLKLTARCQRME